MSQNKAIQYLCRAYHPSTGIFHGFLGTVLLASTLVTVLVALLIIVCFSVIAIIHIFKDEHCIDTLP